MELNRAKMIMPNFIVIGVGKAGTTSLYNYFKQHPQIYMSPVKEPRFFSFLGEKLDWDGLGDRNIVNKSITNIEDYRALFQEVSNEIAIGEASPGYFSNPKVPERIKNYIPNVKLIAILRDPAERAYSHFLHKIRLGYEPFTDFAKALQEEQIRVRNNWSRSWHYKQTGYYYSQVKRYFDTFDRTQIKIYLYEDLKTNPADLLKDAFEFLGVNKTFVPDISVKYNTAQAIPKNQAWHTFLSKDNSLKAVFRPLIPNRLRQKLVNQLKKQNLSKPTLSLKVRQELIEEYREDILKLQDLIQRDLSKWLK